MQTIPIKNIKRTRHIPRTEFGNLQGLADSIQRNGLIQPIVLDHDNNLIAGERRIRAHELIKRDDIAFIFHDQIPEDVRAEMEFEENFWRKGFSWQEEALGILSIYQKKKMKAALEGWTAAYQQIVADMFGMSIGNVNYVLAVAKKLESETKLPDEKRRYWKFTSAAEAYRMGILGDEADAKNKILAERQRLATNSIKPQVVEVVPIEDIDLTVPVDAKEKYYNNPLNPPGSFEDYVEAKRKIEAERSNTIYISNRFQHIDALQYMGENKAMFDHVVTDPPYGINIDYMDQESSGATMQDIDKLKATHDECENALLLKDFFPLAYYCTRDNAFVVTWCDAMLWERLCQWAIDAGFKVQRWPFIWRKVNQSIMNQSSGYNTSKDYEIALIARKPGATLVQKRNSSVIDASNVQATKDTGHPFAKPYEATRALLDTISAKGQSILDPFMGGGSIIIEGLRQERSMFGCDIDEKWYNQALTNIKTHHYLKLNPKYVFK